MSTQDTTPCHLQNERDHTTETSSPIYHWLDSLATSSADRSDDTSSHFNLEQAMRFPASLPDHRLARVLQSSSQPEYGGCRTSQSGNPSEGSTAAFDKYRDYWVTAPARDPAAAHATIGSDAPPAEVQTLPRRRNGSHYFADVVSDPPSLRGAVEEVSHPESDYGWTRQCTSPEPIHAFVGLTLTNHSHSETQMSDYITSIRSPSSFMTPSVDVMQMHAGNIFDIDESSHDEPVYTPHRYNSATNIPSSSFPSYNDQSTVGPSRALTFPSSRLRTEQIPSFVDWGSILAGLAHGGNDRSPPATNTYHPDVLPPTNIPSPCLTTNLFDERVSSILPKELPSISLHSQLCQRDCFIHRSTAPNPYGVVGPPGSSATQHPQAQHFSPPHGSQARPPAHADPSPPIDPYSGHATSTSQLSWKEPLRQPPAPSWSTDSGVAFSTTHLTFALPDRNPGHLELRGSSEVEPYELPQATYTQGNRKPNLDGIPDSISYGSRCRLDRLHAGDVSCVANADDVPFPLGVLSTKPSFRFRFDGYNSYDRQVNVSRVTHGRPIPPNRSRLAVLASGEMKRFLKQCETEMKQCKTEMKQCETEMKPFPYRMEELFLLRIDFTAKGTLQPRFGVYKH